MDRTLKCKIANDNGRASEFIRRKEYKDKSKCYECGVSFNKLLFVSRYLVVFNLFSSIFTKLQELNHLSYVCPKNKLGDRKPPPKKKKHQSNINTPRFVFKF